MIRDLSGFALKLYSQPSTTQEQMKFFLQMIKRPAIDQERLNRVWQEQVYILKDEYEMNP
jgi:acyl-CoA dehydrogenase